MTTPISSRRSSGNRIEPRLRQGLQGGRQGKEVGPGHPFQGKFGGNRGAGIEVLHLGPVVGAERRRVEEGDRTDTAFTPAERRGEPAGIGGQGVDGPHPGHHNAISPSFYIHGIQTNRRIRMLVLTPPKAKFWIAATSIGRSSTAGVWRIMAHRSSGSSRLSVGATNPSRII